MVCNLQTVLFSIELRRNLAESKQRKKATDYSVAFFLTDHPLRALLSLFANDLPCLSLSVQLSLLLPFPFETSPRRASS
ncbi:hypothetical protein B8P98_27515 [Klebsiella quasivariicola]|nr:hypothetical protein B8P98_27515 [Klebsiella quasivariicola]